MNLNSDSITEHIPHLIFSKKEKYYPCDIFFSGSDIKRNKEEYELRFTDDTKKINQCCSYFHFSEGKNYYVYQYWFYYVYNPYNIVPFLITDNHEHDLECVKIFVGKKSGIPEFLTCNIHTERMIIQLENGVVPDILVEEGGHGMLAKQEPFQKPWFGFKWKEGGYDSSPAPSKSCEKLREDVMVNPEIIDKEFKLIGNDYSIVGAKYSPSVPWARWEYYKPEETLLGFDKLKSSLNSISVGHDETRLPQAIMRSRQKGIITSEQYHELSGLIPGLKKEETLGSPPIEVLFRQPAVQALNQVNIHSIDDIMSLETEDIQARLKTSIKQNKVPMRVPSKKSVNKWKKAIKSIK